MQTTRIANGKYSVTVNNVLYCVYQSEGLWFAKNQATQRVTDAAPTKAELYRSLEQSA